MTTANTCAVIGSGSLPYRHACTCGSDLGRCYVHDEQLTAAYELYRHHRLVHYACAAELVRQISLDVGPELDEADAREQQQYDRLADSAQAALVCIRCGRPTDGYAYCPDEVTA